MKQSEETAGTFMAKLFQSFVLSKSQPQPNSANQQQTHDLVKFAFYQNFNSLLQTFKSAIKNLCSQAHQFQESIARKIINTMMVLTRDLKVLLDDGILNIYMDLVEMKQKGLNSQNFNQQRKFVEECILLTEPLLLEFFVFREYLKFQRAETQRLKKSQTQLKQFDAELQQESGFTSKPKSKSKLKCCEISIDQIRQLIQCSTINELLKEFLNEYESELRNLEEVCKICNKNVKLHHLQQHVIYCQKRYLIKQDLKSLMKKIIALANEQILKINNIQNSGACSINSGPLTATQDINLIGNKEYSDLLYEVLNIHRMGSLKNNSKKTNSETKIKEHTQKYEELIARFQNFLLRNQENQELTCAITSLLNLEKQILNLTADLVKVEAEYEIVKEVESAETIKPPSSSCKMSEKQSKSRFAGKNLLQIPDNQKSRGKKSCTSRVSFRNAEESDSNQNNQKKIQEKVQCIKYDFQSSQNFDEENLPFITIKTKQSLGNNKNVHFHVDDDEDEDQNKQKPKSTLRIDEGRNKNSRRVKSLVMFDNSDESDLESDKKKQDQEEYITSERSSRAEETVGVKDFEVLKFLGKGAFGKVYAVRKKNTTDLYALKMIDIDENWGPQEFQQIRNEHEIFKKVAGQHLVQAPYCFSEGGVHIFMMEFMPGGDLSKILEEQIYLEESKAKYVIAEIVLAIEHLHRADIIHRDLKPENLVIDERGHLKLTDFGLSEIKLQNKIEKVMNIKKEKEELAKRRRTRRTGMVAAKSKAKIIGTPDYIAPEIINSISINNRSIDWWSLGVIAYEILIGVRPFCGNTIEEVLDNILKFNIEWPEIGQEEGMISEKAYDFIQKLLSKDFMNRLGAQDISQIKNHPFFEGVNWQSLKSEKAHITPNYAKIKQLLEMEENELLRNQIEQKTQKAPTHMKMPELDNFIRFDILGQKTVKEANMVMSKKAVTLRRLRSIKDIMAEKQNEVGCITDRQEGKTNQLRLVKTERGLTKFGSTLQIPRFEEDF